MSLPPQATLSVSSDGDGDAFTATIGGIGVADRRCLRYRASDTATWTAVVGGVGTGTLQVTGLGAGSAGKGYLVEAFGRNTDGDGPSSTRSAVWVDAGTAASYPPDARWAATWERLLADSAERATLHHRLAASTTFEPEDTAALGDVFDDYGPLRTVFVQGVPQNAIAGGGDARYLETDCACWVAAADLLDDAISPAVGDELTVIAIGVRFIVIAVQLRHGRTAWMMSLRAQVGA